MTDVGPQPNPFNKLTDKELETHIRAANAHLIDLELETIEEDTLPDDLPPTDILGPAADRLSVYRPEDWET